MIAPRRWMAIAIVVALAGFGAATPAPAAAAALGSISGTFGGNGGVVTLYSAADDSVVRTTSTYGFDTRYSFTGLPAGGYKIYFDPSDVATRVAPQLGEYWQDADSLATATVITLADGQAVTGIDPTLTSEIAAITATVAGPGAIYYWGVTFTLYDRNGDRVTPRTSIVQGDKLSMWGLPDGEYRLAVHYVNGGQVFASTFVGDTPFLSESPLLTVTSGTPAAAGTITMPDGLIISGRATADDGDPTVVYPDVEIRILNPDTNEFEPFDAPVNSYPFTNWSTHSLWPGTYRVRIGDQGNPYRGAEWWPDSRIFEGGQSFTVVDSNTPLLNVELSAFSWYADRLYGDSRFTTNRALSQSLFPPSGAPWNVPVIYIANGRNYPDALSAGPAAVHRGGGLLLVEPTAIPGAIASELDRLNPQEIIVVGGPSQVSDAVLDQLVQYAPSAADVKRIAGANRYETSRQIVWDAFGCDVLPCSVTDVFISNGRNYPDALAAGPAAATVDAPVIMVAGDGAGLDAETRQLLLDLGAQRAWVTGGPGSVSPGIVSDLQDLLPDGATVFAGVNRYDTAYRINEAFFGATDLVFVASGTGFADALAGGPLVSAEGAPLYLSPPSCLSAYVPNGMVGRDASLLVLLGGAPSLGSAVENATSIC